MIDIFICEDNKKHLNILRSCISNFILMEGFDMQIIQATPDPHTILKELTNAENTGLFFLDIDLKSDMNGLMLAQKIRQIQPRCFIVFITSHSEMSFLTFQYKAEALDFIIKDTTEHIKAKIHESSSLARLIASTSCSACSSIIALCRSGEMAILWNWVWPIIIQS